LPPTLGHPIGAPIRIKVNDICADIRKIAGLPIIHRQIEPLDKRQGIKLRHASTASSPLETWHLQEVYAHPCQTLEILLANRSYFGRVDRMQRNFEPMRKQVEMWRRSELTDVTAKVVIYEAFVEGKLEAPKHLARTVHDLYFEPKYEEFRGRIN
jgi:hypothetical protein